MKKNTHIELNMKSTWIIDFQLTHMLRGAHTFSPNSVKPQSCQGSLAMVPGKLHARWQLSEVSSGVQESGIIG